MKTRSFATLAIFCSISSLAFALSPVLRWDTNVQQPRSQDWQLRRGESVIFEPHFLTSDRANHDLSGATTVYLRYTHLNPATNLTYYCATGSVHSATGGTVRVAWTSANEAPATNYAYEIAVINTTQTLVRAFGKLSLSAGVGDSASATAPTALQSIDWATVVESNAGSAPFATAKDAVAAGLTGSHTWIDASGVTNVVWYSHGVCTNVYTNGVAFQ